MQLQTKAQLLEQARANATKVKELNAKVTVASGAVVGGPIPPSPTVGQSSGGTAQ